MSLVFDHSQKTLPFAKQGPLCYGTIIPGKKEAEDGPRFKHAGLSAEGGGRTFPPTVRTHWVFLAVLWPGYHS